MTLPGNELVAQRYVFTPGEGGDTRYEHSVAPPGLSAYHSRFDERGLLREEVSAEVPGGGAANNPTRVEYDLEGAPTRVVRPDTSAVTFAYDALGRLQRFTVPGAAVAYEYAGPGQSLNAVECTVTASPGDGSRLTMGYELGVPKSGEWATFPFGFARGLVERDPATGASLTGLVRFGARDYDPETRQWLERDPSGFSGGLNLYGYAEEFALSRGTTVLELYLNTVRDRIAADLRTQASRDAAAAATAAAAAAAAEEVEMYANLLRVSRADAEVILRRMP